MLQSRVDKISNVALDNDNENENENDLEITAEDNIYLDIVHEEEHQGNDGSEQIEDDVDDGEAEDVAIVLHLHEEEHLSESEMVKIEESYMVETFDYVETNEQQQPLELELEQPQNADNQPAVVRSKKQQYGHHVCEICDRLFTRKSTLEQHRNTHTGEKNFSCTKCNAKFTRKAHLFIHLRIHNNDKPYVCEVCKRGFVKSSDLLRHRRVHSDDRNYHCTECPKRFKRSADVATHMRSHTGEKPYVCADCQKSYTSHSSLKKHWLSVHAGGGEKLSSFTCVE